MGKEARVQALKAVPSVTEGAVALSPEQYWHLRARLLEHQALPAQLQKQLESSKADVDALLAKAGLDPAKMYRLDDATKTAVPQ